MADSEHVPPAAHLPNPPHNGAAPQARTVTGTTAVLAAVDRVGRLERVNIALILGVLALCGGFALWVLNTVAHAEARGSFRDDHIEKHIEDVERKVDTNYVDMRDRLEVVRAEMQGRFDKVMERLPAR